MKNLGFGVALALLLGGCASPSYILDYQQDVDFDSLHSYALQSPVNQEAGATESLTDERVRRILAATLQEKGFQAVEPGQADFLATWSVRKETEIRREGFSYGFGYGVRGGNTGIGISLNTRPPATEVERGRLVVEMMSPDANRVIWSAVATKNLSLQGTPEEKNRELQELISDMLTDLPPRPAED